jgi:hypothetical protein
MITIDKSMSELNKEWHESEFGTNTECTSFYVREKGPFRVHEHIREDANGVTSTLKAAALNLSLVVQSDQCGFSVKQLLPLGFTFLYFAIEIVSFTR